MLTLIGRRFLLVASSMALGFAAVPSTGAQAPGSQSAPAEAGGVRARLADLPVGFEPNVGQAAEGVRYLSRLGGVHLALSDHGVSFSVPPATPASGPAGPSSVLSMGLAGASDAPAVAASDRFPGVVNDYTGGEAHPGIPVYGRVRYREVYPGIDMVVRGLDGSMEYRFVLSPGADPAAIGLRFRGADAVRLNGLGDLLVATRSGGLVQRAPTIYQPVGGSHRPVSGGFVIDGDVVTFEVGSYDPSRPLVIDPMVNLIYGAVLGGGGTDRAFGVAVDPTGSAVVVGETRDDVPQFPTTPGAFDTTQNGNYDAFVARLAPGTGAFVYATFLGGSDFDAAYRVDVDGAGNAYVTGETDGPGFPTTPGAADTTLGDCCDAFITKLTPAGALAYSTLYGGDSSYEYGYGLAVDASGAAYVTGETGSSDLFTTAGAYDTTQGGSYDAFLVKVNPAGTAFDYSTYLGGGSYEGGYGLAVDGSGNAYVTGETDSTDFPTTGGALDTTLGGGYDAFLTKVNPAGGGASDLVYSTYLGGSSGDYGQGIAVDGGGSAYVAGRTNSATFPTTGGAFDTTLGGSSDAFVSKITLAGGGSTDLVYSTYLGGSDVEAADGLAIDGSGSAYVTGYTTRPINPPMTPFPSTPGAFDTVYNGNEAFATQLDPAGTALVSSTLLGGGSSDYGEGIDVDAAGNVYVAGYSNDSHLPFPTTVASAGQSYMGTDDAFVAMLGVANKCHGKKATVTGSDGKDTVRGSNDRDVIVGLGGNDKLSGQGGKDTICGGPGKDTLKGGPDNDLLIGGGGKDTCQGGPGRDKAKACEKGRA